MKRRGFFAAIAAALVAPVVAKALPRNRGFIGVGNTWSEIPLRSGNEIFTGKFVQIDGLVITPHRLERKRIDNPIWDDDDFDVVAIDHKPTPAWQGLRRSRW